MFKYKVGRVTGTAEVIEVNYVVYQDVAAAFVIL